MAEEPRKFKDEVADSLSKLSSGPAQRQPRAVAQPAAGQAAGAEPDAAQTAQGLHQMAPPPELPPEDPVLAHKRARRARAAAALNKSIKFKQTLVPVLLTTTVMMLITACTKWVAGEDSPFRIMPKRFTYAFLGFSALMGLLAVLTLWQLKHQLAAQRQMQAQPS